jgi:uncharacterized protein DUF4136
MKPGETFMLSRTDTALTAFMLLCAVSCAPNIDIKTDYDQSADFTKYQTFAFAGMTDLNQSGVLSNSLTRKRIETALTAELTKKNLRQVELDQHPDLLVHYWVGMKDKQMIDTTAPAMGAYGWHGRYGYGAGYAPVTTYEYREGTLITDLVDAAKKELVWRATMMANLENNAADNIELGKQAIAKAFENYPPTKHQ